jgi:hypothetical protein
MNENTVKLYAQFLNEGISIALSIMSPIWNSSQNQAYSLSVDGAGILERIDMWSNDYISGDREKDFNKYFAQNIQDLRKDSRYTNKTNVQEFCNKYETLLNEALTK